MHKDMKEILFTQEQITERCKELGAQISKDYEGKKLLLIGLLKGSIPFLAELSKYIEGDVYFDYMSVSSYKGTESGTIHIKKDVDIDVKGMDVLIVEDILDTGKTLDTVTHMLKDRGTASCEIVTMLDKQQESILYRLSMLGSLYQNYSWLVMVLISIRDLETYHILVS